MEDISQPDPHDPSRYGRSFAEVYDQWYPPDGASDAAVKYLLHVLHQDQRVLELGIGTGRLAIPLAMAGLTVDGIDASEDMLVALADKLRQVATTPAFNNEMIEAVLGDVADPLIWPDRRYGLILGAFNLLFNVTAPDGIENVFVLAAQHLEETGLFVIETFEPDLPDRVQSDMTVKAVTLEGVDLIATTTDPDSQQVIGQHIELRTQPGTSTAAVTLRPWVLRVVTLDQLDTFAAHAGLTLQQRFASWDEALQTQIRNERAAVDADSMSRRTAAHFDGAGIISVYSRLNKPK